MAITKEWGFSPTSSSKSWAANDLNFSDNFARVNPRSATTELILANRNSPLDRVETLRYAYSQVANVYTGTGLDASLQSQNKRGVSILAQVRETLKVVDSDLQTSVVLPFEAHLVLRIPQHEVVGVTEVYQLISRLLGMYYEDADTHTDARVSALLRGALAPNGVN